jgi:hypothetical protein
MNSEDSEADSSYPSSEDLQEKEPVSAMTAPLATLGS